MNLPWQELSPEERKLLVRRWNFFCPVEDQIHAGLLPFLDLDDCIDIMGIAYGEPDPLYQKLLDLYSARSY